MEILITILRWLVFALILGGFTFVIHKRFQIDLFVVPVVVMTAIGTLVYLAGLVGGMLVVTWLLLVAGLACGCYAIQELRQVKVTFYNFSPTQFLFFVGFFAFMIQIANTNLIHYDNFTHWAVVVKELLITNQFPTAESVMVEYYNYPLGTASWIYFVCTVVGHGESAMLMAQGLLIFACFYATFASITERRRFLLPLVLGFGCTTLSYFNITIRMNTLLVDFLLPILALAALSVLYCYRQAWNRALVLVCPILSFLMVVKSTGILFAAVPLGYLLYLAGKYHRNAQAIGRSVATVALSTVTLVLWNIHMAVGFAGVENKFETSFAGISNNIDKTAAQMQTITHLYWDSLLDVSLRPTQGILFYNGFALVALFVAVVFFKKKWSMGKVLVIGNLIMAAYFAGILAMYLYSMPLGEALYLAGYERYASSIVILFGGMIALCLTVDLDNSFEVPIGNTNGSKSFKSIESKKAYNMTAGFCAMMIFLVLSSEMNGVEYYNEHEYRDSLPATFRNVIGDNWSAQPNENRYLLFAPDENMQVTNYYIQYVGRYYLRAHEVDAICLFYEPNLLNLVSQYDYLVIVQSTPEQMALLEKYFGVDGAVGIYDTAELLANYNLQPICEENDNSVAPLR